MNLRGRSPLKRGDGPPGPAVIMFVEIEPDDVKIIRAEATDHPPPIDGCPSEPSAEGRPSGAGGTREIRVAFLDPGGIVLSERGYAAGAVTFFDQPDRRRADRLAGGSLPRVVDRRLLHVAVPEGAASLLFYKPDGPGGGAGGQRPSGGPIGLAVYDLLVPAGADPPPIPPGEFLVPVPLPHKRSFPRDAPFRPPVIGPRRRAPADGSGTRMPGSESYIHSAETLKKCEVTDPGRCFDIVILGDGFAEVELDMFNDRVSELIRRLLLMPPFDSPEVQKHLAIHVVRTVSRHSGVDSCPYPPVRKETYFDIEGNWNNVGHAGFFGTPREDKIYDAGALIAPPDRIRLYVMLVNTALLGGRGDPLTHIAYASIVSDVETFVNLVAHESAHAFGCLADEYIGCDPDQPHHSYPNLATEHDVQTGTVKWKPLATPYELNADGTFVAVHRIGDKIDDCSGEPILAPGLQGMLGLFWGCMYIDRNPRFLDECDPWTNPKGARYYRPMARCKMRKLDWPFCRVCRHRIATLIRGGSATRGEG